MFPALIFALLAFTPSDFTSPDAQPIEICEPPLTDCGKVEIVIPKGVSPEPFIEGWWTGYEGPWPFTFPSWCEKYEHCIDWWDGVNAGSFTRTRCESNP